MNLMNSPWETQPLTEHTQRMYHAYPHANGFADGGNSVILAHAETRSITFWRHDFRAAKQVQVFECAREGADEPLPFFDVALSANLLVVSSAHTAWGVDLSSGAIRQILSVNPDTTLGTLPSVRSDGSAILFEAKRDNEYAILHLDMKSGGVVPIVRRPWHANHCHFSPADPDWVCFAHEGNTLEIPDRVWAWHARYAPEGKCVMNQFIDPKQPRRFLAAGHERACWHDASSLVIGYGVSEIGPRGLYEVFYDGRPQRLVSGGERDWHCNVAQDGRYAVVDTSGPADRPGSGWVNADGLSDIVLVDMKIGDRRTLARGRHAKHPWHPHPAFSPDGERILYSDADPSAPAGAPSGRVMCLTLKK